MSTYKNYVVKQSDTLETIAQRQLGDTSAWPSLIPLNKLRYPYISDDIRDQYGTPHAELMLPASVDAGDISINLKTYVDSGMLPESLLTSKSIFFVRRYDGNGDYVHDALTIDTYYPSAYAIKKPDNTYQSVAAGTVVFDALTLENPTTLALQYVSTINGGSLPARTYYVKYTYITHNGETMTSPDNIDSDSGARIGIAIPQNELMSMSSPIIWPDNVIGVNVYVGTNPELLYKQQNGLFATTFTAKNQTYVEPTNGITLNTQKAPVSNTAKIGFLHSYEIGIIFSIHSDPNTFDTQVLKTGDIIHLETSQEQTSRLIINKHVNTQAINTFGTDIKINELGFLTFDSQEYPGDTTTVTGLSNVRQAIRSRLLTKYGALTTRPTFGNTALTLLGERYRVGFLLKVRGELQKTILSEQRIQSVDNIVLNYDATTGACTVTNLSATVAENGVQLNFNPIVLPI